MSSSTPNNSETPEILPQTTSTSSEFQTEQVQSLTSEQKHRETLSQANYSDLQNRVKNLEQKNKDLENNIKNLNQNFNSFKQEVNQAQQEVQKEFKELQDKYIALQTELLNHLTNKDDEYDSFSKKPQQYDIIKKFAHIRNNGFRDVADIIFDLRKDNVSERDKIVDRIVSILAEKILVEQGKNYLQKKQWLKVEDIIQSIKNKLQEKKLLSSNINSRNLDTELKALIAEANKLIKDMDESGVKSCFLWDQKSQHYNPDSHFLRWGKEDNKVIFEIFPGYVKQGKIIEKVWITTENLENV
jgi:hypothetical protein